jgi:formate dehydrogenase major subunit
MHPKVLERLGLAPADRAVVRSRRGAITLKVRADSGLAQGDVFIPFAYAEAAANALTNAALDPAAKIPELKYCAVQVVRASSSS